MKKLVLALAAVATVGTALPAAAQTWQRPVYGHPVYGHPFYNGIEQRDATLTARVVRAEQRGRISRYVANRLRIELRNIRYLAHSWGRDGLNHREMANLNLRLDRVQVQLQRARA